MGLSSDLWGRELIKTVSFHSRIFFLQREKNICILVQCAVEKWKKKLIIFIDENEKLNKIKLLILGNQTENKRIRRKFHCKRKKNHLTSWIPNRNTFLWEIDWLTKWKKNLKTMDSLSKFLRNSLLKRKIEFRQYVCTMHNAHIWHFQYCQMNFSY